MHTHVVQLLVLKSKDISHKVVGGVTSLKFKIPGIRNGLCVDFSNMGASCVPRTSKSLLSGVERERDEGRYMC